MFAPGELLPKYKKKYGLQNTKKDLTEAQSHQRSKYIASSLSNGKTFVKRVKKYGRNEKGLELSFTPSFEEVLELIGDFRIHETVTSGAAQIGKTLSHTLLVTDLLVSGKLNFAWFYSSRSSLEANVPEQFIPIVENWVEAYAQRTGVNISASSDRKTSGRYQVDGTTAIFTYTSTSKVVKSKEGLAKTGGAAVSFTANMAVIEERSQHVPGAIDGVPRRLDASLIPTKPIRTLGTPGSGSGVEKELLDCTYEFYPFFTCPSCGVENFLDPRGCLLREVEIKDPLGKTKKTFFSASGRPLLWFHKDPNRKIETAYIGCPNCEEKIPRDIRVNAVHKCLKTGITFRDFMDNLSPEISDVKLKVGIHRAALLRDSKINLAAELINSGFICIDPSDWMQQSLGFPSEYQQSGLTLEILKSCIGNPHIRFREKHLPIEFTVCGIDMGRASDWIWIQTCVLPLDYKKYNNNNELLGKIVRNVLFAGTVNRDDIPALLEQYGVDYGLIDNEPSRESSFNISEGTVLEIADQRNGLKEVYKRDIVLDGGRSFPCVLIRNEKFLTQVLNTFLTLYDDDLSLMRLPEDWDMWVSDRSELSPLRHLSGPFIGKDGKWQRPSDHIDDLYFACNFAEAALYIHLEENVMGTSWLSDA